MKYFLLWKFFIWYVLLTLSSLVSCIQQTLFHYFYMTWESCESVFFKQVRQSVQNFQWVIFTFLDVLIALIICMIAICWDWVLLRISEKILVSQLYITVGEVLWGPLQKCVYTLTISHFLEDYLKYQQQQ